MAQPNRPSDNISYDLLPLEHPPSPVPGTSFNDSPRAHSLDLPGDDLGLPEGAAPPRFLGQALYQEGPSDRNSYASSHQTFPSQSEYSSSVYALNDTRNPQSLSNYEGQYRDDPHEVGRDTGMPMSPIGRSRHLLEKRAAYASPKSKRKIIILAAIAALILVLLAIIIPVYFAVVKPSSKNSESGNSSNDSSSDGGGGGKGSTGKVAAVTGKDGSLVTLEDGTTFVYQNTLGGQWYYDVNDPYNSGARAQSWTPALNETFDYKINRIRGVNLGGWFTIEPFIVPALFEKYQNSTPVAVDEWTLHQAMAADTDNGGINQLEDHYKTFITERDFAEIAAAGLNHLRIPIPFWFIETWPSEPFEAKVGWKYVVKALDWARKYGLRVNLDFHAVPGSQNGWNHSGKLGEISFLRGLMGLANSQRTLSYIRILAEFISQPQYRDVVTMLGILNEPRGVFLGQLAVFSFYTEAYRIVREASGGVGGPTVAFHDAFYSRDDFAKFLPNAQSVALDSHPYIAFGTQTTDNWEPRTGIPCGWGKDVNKSMSTFGLTIAGEFSNAINDCGLWVNGVGQGVRYDGSFKDEPSPRVGDCTQWTDWKKYDDETKKQIKQFAMASMDGLYNYFFWTWKIGNSSASGQVESPAWSYQLGLENGWMPKDSREADGFCKNTDPFLGTLTEGNGQVDFAQYPWPPTSILEGGPVTNLPTYTPTGSIPTLTGAPLTVSGLKPTKSVDPGNGWANSNDNAGAMTKISGCDYPDPWVGTGGSVPTPWCSGQKKRKEEVFVPVVTTAPH